MARQGSSRRDEQGAVAPMVAIMLVVLVMFAAFAVDLGMQRVVARDMQALADLAALDAARQLDGRAANDSSLIADVEAAVAASVVRNATTLGTLDGQPTVRLGTLDAAGNFLPGGNPATAVEVTARSTVGFVFAQVGGGPSEGSATRSAVAEATTSACFRMGSYALQLATNDSILAALLGNAAATRVLGYQGLATAEVSLLGLATELGLGSPHELVDANLTLGELLDAAAVVLNQEGESGLAAELLTLKTDLGARANAQVDLGELLDLGVGTGSVATASVNLLHLITGTVMVANGENLIRIADLDVNAGGTTLRANLRVIEVPRLACNDGEARTGQIQLRLQAMGPVKLLPTSGLNSLLGLLGLNLTTVDLEVRNLLVTLDAASAKARLTPDLTCGSGSVSVDVYEMALADVTLTGSVWLGTLRLLPPGTTWTELARLVDVGTAPYPGGTHQLLIPEHYDTPLTVGPAVPPSVTLSSGEVVLLGSVNLGPLVNLVNSVLAPVQNLLLGPVFDALGISVAGADLWAVRQPTCQHPALRG
ncbi:pilus assembly protein TadG-related protein [Nocardioides limicola]|uniref:pilus assembly protein TadG-related protein n=1 Tax=Nocardioides limicola TaxID=2803368 RepID=UPI00193C7139|nr:pilus assembly protein TadG-related protein [Nocardioides sp. DJM-14]